MMKRRCVVLLASLLACTVAGLATSEGQLEQGLRALQEQKFDIAMKTLVPLGKAGSREASEAIAKMFAEGNGVPQNFKWAYSWYRRAEILGSKEAGARALALSTRLSAQGIEEAEFWASERSLKLDKRFGCLSYYGDFADGTRVTAFRESATVGQMVTDIVSFSGLRKNFSVREANVPNAAAVIDPPGSSNRELLYNPSFMSEVRTVTGTSWGPYSVVAHEIGHHLQGHTLEGTGSRPAIELEADEFSGFILYNMGATLDEAEATMRVLASDRGSSTHPPKVARLEAISQGYARARQLNPRIETGPRPEPPPLPEPSRETRRPRRDGVPPVAPGPGYPPIAVSCQTPVGACPMSVPVVRGAVCYCLTIRGTFMGTAY